MHQVHKNLRNKNGLPHSFVELYAYPVRISVLKEYGLPHTVVCTLQTQEFIERIWFTPHYC